MGHDQPSLYGAFLTHPRVRGKGQTSLAIGVSRGGTAKAPGMDPIREPTELDPSDGEPGPEG